MFFFSLDFTWGRYCACNLVQDKMAVFIWFRKNLTSTYLILRTESALALCPSSSLWWVLWHYNLDHTVFKRSLLALTFWEIHSKLMGHRWSLELSTGSFLTSSDYGSHFPHFLLKDSLKIANLFKHKLLINIQFLAT